MMPAQENGVVAWRGRVTLIGSSNLRLQFDSGGGAPSQLREVQHRRRSNCNNKRYYAVIEAI